MSDKPCRECGKRYEDSREYFTVHQGKLTNQCKFCNREERRKHRSQGKEIINRGTEGGYVLCQVCGDALIQITGSHTIKHGLTFAQYKERFPDAPTMCAQLRKKMSEQAIDEWKTHRPQLMEHIKDLSEKQRGAGNPRWKGGYDPGGELYEAGLGGGDAKFKARRRALRLHGHECMIPGCDFNHVVQNHHIVPRSEGGTHKRDNCIVLCPNHHALADAGVLTREYLKSILAERLNALE
jgi:hypothetical protein